MKPGATVTTLRTRSRSQTSRRYRAQSTGSGTWDPCCPRASRKANVNVFDGRYLNLHDSFVSDSENYATWVDGKSTLDSSDNTLGDPAGSA